MRRWRWMAIVVGIGPRPAFFVASGSVGERRGASALAFANPTDSSVQRWRDGAFQRAAGMTSAREPLYS